MVNQTWGASVTKIKLPSERIEELLTAMLPKNYDDVTVRELFPEAIKSYLDEVFLEQIRQKSFKIT